MQEPIEWTEGALAGLDGYFERAGDTLRASGADPDEVKEDVRQHINESCREQNLNLVTQDDVRRFLRRMDLPEAELQTHAAADRTLTTAQELASLPGPLKLRYPQLFTLVGVVLPLCCLVLYAPFHFDRDVSFQVVPTWLHALLILLIPIWSLLRLFSQHEPSPQRLRGLLLLTGMITGVSAFYSLIFAPFTLMGIMLVLALGFGLLFLAPLLSLWLSIQSGIIPLWKEARRQWIMPLGYLVAGCVLAWGLLIGVEAPRNITQLGLMWATSSEPATRQQGLDWLRNYGSRQQLLEACYDSQNRMTNLLGHLITFDVTTDQAREVFYRVNGRTFNTYPVPALGFGRNWNPDGEFFFDADQGSDIVGGRLKNLDMSASRLDASIDARAALGYLEWTMEFANTAKGQKEARALIQLPPGAVVSRLTLWINGKPQEAAFGGSGQVREAYEKVVQARRDPVLVTSKGPDQVLMQCFPINAGTPMKVRLGISYPLQMKSLNTGQLQLPRLLERNFNLPESLKHSVWLEAHSPLQAQNQWLTASTATVKGKPVYALRGELTSQELNQRWIQVPRDPNQITSYARDSKNPQQLVVQTLSARPAVSKGPLFIVIDGSESLREHREQILTGLKKWPPSQPLTAVFVTDFAPRVHEHISPAQLRELIQKYDFTGGRDNQSALASAWDLAESRQGSLLWLTGPQPLLMTGDDGLSQRWERRPDSAALDVIAFEPGPNQILNALSDFAPVRVLRSQADFGDELGQYWQSRSEPRLDFQREARSSASVDTAGMSETSSHLFRLWARDQAEALIGKNKRDEALKLATGYQLVTPVSGAVVLENADQYRDAGLKPVSQLTVPTVPEPETWLLLLTLLAVLVTLWLRRRKLLPA